MRVPLYGSFKLDQLFYLIWGFCREVNCTLVPGNTKGGSITVLLTSSLTGLESAV
jgi:hypothetical protein